MAKVISGDEFARLLAEYFTAEDLQKANLLSSVSSEITRQRISRGMTQKEFASFMHVSKRLISKWENGDYNFTLEQIAEIFTKLDIVVNLVFDAKAAKE